MRVPTRNNMHGMWQRSVNVCVSHSERTTERPIQQTDEAREPHSNHVVPLPLLIYSCSAWYCLVNKVTILNILDNLHKPIA